MLTLYIGNKNYSSWSLRPWLLLKHFEIPFTEQLVSIAGRAFNPALKPISGSGRVPSLHDDGFQIWDSLAIAEYLAEQHPQMWPADARARARARSICAEMHSSFTNLRPAMPMNLKLKLKGKTPSPEVQRDIDRLVEIWEEARQHFANSEGPYLFGAFSVADAMFAPVIWRFHTYNVPLTGSAAAYRDCLLAHPAMQQWHAAALSETEAHAQWDDLASEYGGPRE